MLSMLVATLVVMGCHGTLNKHRVVNIKVVVVKLCCYASQDFIYHFIQ